MINLEANFFQADEYKIVKAKAEAVLSYDNLQYKEGNLYSSVDDECYDIVLKAVRRHYGKLINNLQSVRFAFIDVASHVAWHSTKSNSNMKVFIEDRDRTKGGYYLYEDDEGIHTQLTISNLSIYAYNKQWTCITPTLTPMIYLDIDFGE